MTTGYTAIIEEKPDCTFRDFALRCARGMGACVMQRDDDMDTPPRHRERSTFYAQKIPEARAHLEALLARDPAAWEQANIAKQREIEDYNEKAKAEHARLATVYSAMLAQVEAWKPPTPDHVGMQRLMREQILMCWTPGSKPYLIARERRTLEEFRAAEIKSAREDLTRAESEDAKDAECCAESNAWIDALYASLPPVPVPNV